MKYTLFFKFRFKNRLTNIDQKEIREAINKLTKEDTKISISRLCRTRLEGSIKKPSYDEMGKKPNPRNSFALIKRVKLIAELTSTNITILEDQQK